MKVYLGADHRGFNLKTTLNHFLQALDYEIEDLGAKIIRTNDDYPDYAFAVAHKLAQNPDSFGILICGSGAGMVIAANKVKNIRCNLGLSVDQVKIARENDNINCLSLAADHLTFDEAKQITVAFLETPFSADPKHQRRLDKITTYESSTH